MTETTEHVVESYVRYYLRWFTNSNIRANGNKEIDILAIDNYGNRFWIECGISHQKNWSLKAKSTDKDFQEIKKKDGVKIRWIYKNSVDYFIKNKFKDLRLKEKLKDFGFKSGNYTKIICCWQVKDKETKKYAKKKGIEIWELKEKIGNGLR